MARMRSAKRRFLVAAMTVLVAGVAIWWWRSAAPNIMPQAGTAPQASAAPPRRLVEIHPQPSTVAAPVPHPAATPVPAPTAPPAAAPAIDAPIAAAATAAAAAPGASTSAALNDASAAMAAGNPVQARRLLNQAVDPTSDSPENQALVQELTKLADDMTFSPKIVQNDPLVIKHVVEPGQNLQKIANLYKTTVPLICRVNNLASPNSLRQGQPLKIVLGPFHAVVSKHNFRMAIYCQDTLVKVFPVGLGAENKTPTGRWKIKLKQLHPRYYPPSGGKIFEANDPANPLGGYWMALDGVEGDAVGQERYGIHGTIEPDSIGKNASLGCIRMRNEDVAQVYEMLIVHDSLVTVKD